ncbi:MAG TPA: hypothetical protein VGB96_03005, partial [Archangium sp.]
TGSDHEGRATCFELLGPQLATELWPGVASTLGWLAPGAAGLQNWAAAPGALRSLAMRAAGELLAARARRRPLCLLLDDAQYAEETALDALEYAALAESRLPLWVCVLARPGFERLRPSWGTRAARRHVLPLGPLSPPSAAELCRTLLRPAENIPAAALERLAERAQRIPLFLVELVRGLKRLGLVRQRASGGSWYFATDELDRMPELQLVDWLADRELGALPAELAARARRRPLCLLLDDAQYAEETALDALEYAALAESRLPLWVCVLARPGFERLRPSWGTRAARRHVLPLGPLSPPSAVELCRTLLRPAENIPAAALEYLAERSQRVPLFLVELVRGLKRQGLVRQRAHGGSWFLATDELDRMPELRLVDWLADRELGALPVELAAHARLCALLGPDFTAAEAEGVVHELEEDGGAADFPLDPRHATRRLLDLGLLVSHRQEGLSFRNELLRATVERSLPEADRVRIHRAAFRYYQSRAGAAERQRLPRLALHAAAAGLRDEAAALYIDLAESARGRHAYIEAESTYTRALELLELDDRRRRLTVLRGRG